MTDITIRQYADKVWFLDSTGFLKGWIKTTRVVSEERSPVKITYFVVTHNDGDEFMGIEKDPSEVFDSKEELIKYYQNLK